MQTLSKIQNIRFENLTFRHESQDALFMNVEFDFPMNQIVWIKAMSGSGRSTLLQLLAGLQMPDSGQLLLNSNNVADMSFEEFLPYRMSIGYSFDFGGLLSNKTLLENLTLPLLYHKILDFKEANEKAEEYLQYFDVLKYKDQRPAHIPGGVRKLGVLIRSLIMNPQMLLLDDPSVGLSQQNVYKFADLIHKLRDQGFLSHIFMSSFDDHFMNLFDHQIVHIDNGQLYLETVDPTKKVVHL